MYSVYAPNCQGLSFPALRTFRGHRIMVYPRVIRGRRDGGSAAVRGSVATVWPARVCRRAINSESTPKRSRVTLPESAARRPSTDHARSRTAMRSAVRTQSRRYVGIVSPLEPFRQFNPFLAVLSRKFRYDVAAMFRQTREQLLTLIDFFRPQLQSP